MLFHRKTTVYQSVLGSFEIVPSSNPDSQYSVDELLIMKICTNTLHNSGNEIFEKENMNSNTVYGENGKIIQL